MAELLPREESRSLPLLYLLGICSMHSNQCSIATSAGGVKHGSIFRTVNETGNGPTDMNFISMCDHYSVICNRTKLFGRTCPLISIIGQNLLVVSEIGRLVGF